MEEGNFDEAIKEKDRLEQKQRAVRKEKEKNNIHHQPRFFTEEIDEIDGSKCFRFTNTYWEKRKNNDWSDSPDLF